LIEIEKGAAIADPVLTSLGNPSSIAVDYDDVTTRIVQDDSTVVTDSALADGQRVKVKFAVFTAEPFPAVQIEIEDQPEFEGVITSLAGLPNSIVIHLDSDDPAIAGGAVDDDTTDVVVDLTASSLFLDVHAKPALVVGDLRAGLELEVRGALSGPSSAPTIAANRTKIHAGRLEGVVTAIFEVSNSFDVLISEIDDPFGNNVTVGTAVADFEPGCVFRDEALNAAQFFDLFEALQLGQELEVEVYGLGTATPNQLRVFEIESEVD
jgi:hypothetical protein